MVVRDPNAPIQRLVVFAETSISGRTMSIVHLALIEDEARVPKVNDRRIVLVWADSKVEADGQVEAKGYVFGTNREGEVQELIQRAVSL